MGQAASAMTLSDLIGQDGPAVLCPAFVILVVVGGSVVETHQAAQHIPQPAQLFAMTGGPPTQPSHET
ncbi:hypothetical protein EYC58_05240 [Candidatus Saccharibacteria bacterium]|nr:MAG: hypothetical protein EYC58_05240 [Candidatus Saccharibacteria bacterium]